MEDRPGTIESAPFARSFPMADGGSRSPASAVHAPPATTRGGSPDGYAVKSACSLEGTRNVKRV